MNRIRIHSPDPRPHLPLAASLSGIASYVDIRAKTDTYVGFLSHIALERLLEKRPIVLLTLAKRLISLLSPLGEITLAYLAPLSCSFIHSIITFRLRQCYKSTRRWTGCKSVLVRFCGARASPATAFTSLSMDDCEIFRRRRMVNSGK